MEQLGIALLLVTAVSSQNNRIIGGAPCPPHSMPWQAALFVGSQLNCGGTLISRNWVVTAAHCHVQCPISVRLGEHNIQHLDWTEQLRLSEKMIRHPGYNSASKDNDIMLIKLLTPANLNKNVQPLELPTSCPSPNEECVVSGWGTTKSPQLYFPPVLHCAKVSIFSQEQCRSIYPRYYTENMLCAGVLEGGVDSCQRLSGLANVYGRGALLAHDGIYHPTISLSLDQSTQEIHFLDTTVQISDGHINTTLYWKSTDHYTYLHASSFHPGHITRSIVYSQAL